MNFPIYLLGSWYISFILSAKDQPKSKIKGSILSHLSKSQFKHTSQFICEYFKNNTIICRINRQANIISSICSNCNIAETSCNNFLTTYSPHTLSWVSGIPWRLMDYFGCYLHNNSLGYSYKRKWLSLTSLHFGETVQICLQIAVKNLGKVGNWMMKRYLVDL